jgi:uncharacterized membrane protein YhiD involved in acid resistance
MTYLSSVQLVASGVNVTPNTTAIPGLSTLSTLVGSLMAFGLVLSLAGFVGCAIVMAIGHHSANPQWSTRGKTGLLVCLAAALLIGGSDLLINTFYNLGSSLS